MASGKTVRKNIPFPKTGDGDKLCGDQEAAAKALDEVNEGHQDFLQAGVVAEADWSFTANINSGTGALGSTGNTGGVAWLPDPVVSGALMRSKTTSATLAGLAPTTPASGKYVCVGYELTPSIWGSGATVSVKTGTEKNTQAEAEAAPPATTAGKLKIRDAIVKNTAGVYSIVAQRDRRPWARGAFAAGEGSGAGLIAINSPAAWIAIDATRLQFRVECSGVPLRLKLTGYGFHTTPSEFFVGFAQDSATNMIWDQGVKPSSNIAPVPFSAERIFTPTAGSHLFTAAVLGPNGTSIANEVSAPLSTKPVFSIEEILRTNANNGTI